MDFDHWNYRVVSLDEDVLKVVEVYYDSTGKIAGWCEGEPLGETVDQLTADLDLMREAVRRPVLYRSDLPPETADLI